MRATMENPRDRVEKLSPKESPKDSHTVPQGQCESVFQGQVQCGKTEEA